jgi:hypothetical protein
VDADLDCLFGFKGRAELRAKRDLVGEPEVPGSDVLNLDKLVEW